MGLRVESKSIYSLIFTDYYGRTVQLETTTVKPLVIEGPDNAGKSTLVLALAKDLKAVVINSQVVPTPSEYWVENYVRWYQGAAKLGCPIIFDRHPVISEPIYGSIIRGRTPVTPEYARNIRSTLFVIYCRPPDSIILNLGTRPQMTGVRTHLQSIITEYDNVMLKQSQFAGFLQYDYTRGAYQYFLPTVKRALNL